MTTILVADDEPGVRERLRWELGERGYQVITAGDDDEAMAVLVQHDVDIVLSQGRLAGVECQQFLRRSKQVAPLTEVVIAAGDRDVESAVECVKSGAFGYIQRPYEINDLVATLERASERRQLRAESTLYQMSRVILDTRAPHELPDVIVKVAMEGMHADDVALMLPGHDDKLYTTCSTSLTESIRREVEDSISPQVIGRARMLREPLLESSDAVHSYILYPLCMNERLVGVLLISRLVNPRAFRKLDLDKACVIASQTLLALENLRLVRHKAEIVATLADNGPGVPPHRLPRIVLPRAAKVVKDRTPPIAHTIEGMPLRLLFVDDEASILRSYKRAFRREHQVVAVTNGKEALSAIAQHADFDLVICDLSMPTMSGMQLFHTVRERYPELAARFIFATGGATQRELEDFLRSVTNRVLEKPFDLGVLRGILGELQRVA